jgi:predicted Fe-Mo cluster-binding NifX family protein
MRIVFTSTGKSWDSLIDSRFGRAEYLVLFDEESDELAVTDNSAVKNEAHGAGTATAQKIYKLKPDILITGNGPGENAATAIKDLNMKIFINAHNITLKEAYEQYRNGKLTKL